MLLRLRFNKFTCAWGSCYLSNSRLYSIAYRKFEADPLYPDEGAQDLSEGLQNNSSAKDEMRIEGVNKKGVHPPGTAFDTVRGSDRQDPRHSLMVTLCLMCGELVRRLTFYTVVLYESNRMFSGECQD